MPLPPTRTAAPNTWPPTTSLRRSEVAAPATLTSAAAHSDTARQWKTGSARVRRNLQTRHTTADAPTVPDPRGPATLESLAALDARNPPLPKRGGRSESRERGRRDMARRGRRAERTRWPPSRSGEPTRPGPSDGCRCLHAVQRHGPRAARASLRLLESRPLPCPGRRPSGSSVAGVARRCRPQVWRLWPLPGANAPSSAARDCG
jgi:hypothetical protein